MILTAGNKQLTADDVILTAGNKQLTADDVASIVSGCFCCGLFVVCRCYYITKILCDIPLLQKWRDFDYIRAEHSPGAAYEKEVPMGIKTIQLVIAIGMIHDTVGTVLFNDKRKFQKFLETKQAGLDGLSPLEYLEAHGEGGVEKILDFVKGSKAGEMS